MKVWRPCTWGVFSSTCNESGMGISLYSKLASLFRSLNPRWKVYACITVRTPNMKYAQVQWHLLQPTPSDKVAGAAQKRSKATQGNRTGRIFYCLVLVQLTGVCLLRVQRFHCIHCNSCNNCIQNTTPCANNIASMSFVNCKNTWCINVWQYKHLELTKQVMLRQQHLKSVKTANYCESRKSS